jgi:hypothetical protein
MVPPELDVKSRHAPRRSSSCVSKLSLISIFSWRRLRGDGVPRWAVFKGCNALACRRGYLIGYLHCYQDLRGLNWLS